MTNSYIASFSVDICPGASIYLYIYYILLLYIYIDVVFGNVHEMCYIAHSPNM